MIYDYTDKHILVNALKRKGWVLFELYSSQKEDKYKGWFIDTAISFNTEHYETHKKINGKFLGTNLKGAMFCVRRNDFPINK